MIFLSSVYFGCKGISLYDSVQKAVELGFDGVELRQEHLPAEDVWGELRRIKSNFPKTRFTIHAPLWSGIGIRYLNPAMGLTKGNKKFLENAFKGAEVLEAESVIFHVGFQELILFNHVAWLPRVHWPRLKMPLWMARKRLQRFLESAIGTGKNIGANVLVENPPKSKLALALETKHDFENMFLNVPELGLCFDINHAQTVGREHDFLGFGKRIKEVHVAHTNTDIDLHLPITEENLPLLEKVPDVKKIPLVLEHSSMVKLPELLAEKKLVEKFLKKA